MKHKRTTIAAITLAAGSFLFAVHWYTAEYTISNDALYLFREANGGYGKQRNNVLESMADVRERRQDRTSVTAMQRYAAIDDSLNYLLALNDTCIRQIEKYKRELFLRCKGIDVRSFTSEDVPNRLYDLPDWEIHRNYFGEVSRFISESRPSGKTFGEELMAMLRNLRKKELEVFARHHDWWSSPFYEKKKWYFKMGSLNEYVTDTKWDKQFHQFVAAANVQMDDAEFLRIAARCLQFNRAGESERQWEQRMFGNCSLTGFLERLTSIETALLEAFESFVHSSIYTGCFADLVFYKLDARVDAPAYVIKGQPFDYSVQLITYAEDVYPIVKEPVSVSVGMQGDGKWRMRSVMTGDSLQLKGQAIYFKRSGIPCTIEWRKTVYALRQ